MTSQNSTWGAVVIRRGLSWFARAPRETMNRTTPDWAVTDLPRVVLAAGKLWFPREGEGTVLWQCTENVDTVKMVEELRAGGWRVSDSGHDTGWFTVFRDGYATVHLGIAKLITQHRFPLARLGDEARHVAMALVRYSDLMGASWRGTAGMSGCAQIRAIHGWKPTGSQPLWRWDDAKSADAIRCSFELRGARHTRPITEEEFNRAYVHQFDIRAMYLAASNVALLGRSAPELTGQADFDILRPGYWHVRRDQLRDAPAELVRAGDSSLVWLTTPVMAYLHEQGMRPEIFDSWTSERGGRYLKGWAERLTAALKMTPPAEDAGAPGLERALKDTYKRTVGMMASEGGRIFRPDWRDEIVDRARVNVLRKCANLKDAQNVTPLRYNIDSVWIASNDGPDVVGRGLGIEYDEGGAEKWQIGKFRWITSMTPAVYVAKYERGRVNALA